MYIKLLHGKQIRNLKNNLNTIKPFELGAGEFETYFEQITSTGFWNRWIISTHKAMILTVK